MALINAIIRLMILSTYISKLQTKQHLMERSILKIEHNDNFNYVENKTIDSTLYIRTTDSVIFI